MSTSKNEPLSFGETFKTELIVLALCITAFITMMFFKIQHRDEASINHDIQHLLSAYSECQASKIECVAALEAYAKAHKMQQAYPLAINALKESNQM